METVGPDQASLPSGLSCRARGDSLQSVNFSPGYPYMHDPRKNSLVNSADRAMGLEQTESKVIAMVAPQYWGTCLFNRLFSLSDENSSRVSDRITRSSSRILSVGHLLRRAWHHAFITITEYSVTILLFNLHGCTRIFR